LAFPALAAVHLFPCGSSASLSSYRPLNQLRPGSSFLDVPPPQSSFAQISRSHLSMPAYLPRVSSLIAASPERVHFREGSHAFATFRPQVFATSRRFPPPSGFTGFFHPAATSRVVAVQGLLSPRSGAGSSPARSPLPLPPRALTGHCLGECRFRVFAGHRMPRSGCPDFEAFLRAR
jgi:hypothetical protein